MYVHFPHKLRQGGTSKLEDKHKHEVGFEFHDAVFNTSSPYGMQNVIPVNFLVKHQY